MELWIRSQDREKLCKAYYISLNYESNMFWLSNNDGKIYTTIGTYKTKERALEVLDEIQNIILLQSMYKYDNKELMKAWTELSEKEIANLRQQICVYEMPEE